MDAGDFHKYAKPRWMKGGDEVIKAVHNRMYPWLSQADYARRIAKNPEFVSELASIARSGMSRGEHLISSTKSLPVPLPTRLKSYKEWVASGKNALTPLYIPREKGMYNPEGIGFIRSAPKIPYERSNELVRMYHGGSYPKGVADARKVIKGARSDIHEGVAKTGLIPGQLSAHVKGTYASPSKGYAGEYAKQFGDKGRVFGFDIPRKNFLTASDTGIPTDPLEAMISPDMYKSVLPGGVSKVPTSRPRYSMGQERIISNLDGYRKVVKR